MGRASKSRGRRPQPATVLAALALIVSLSAGSAAVASHLTVRSSDIVDGAVRTRDLADDAATGAKVKESTLGKVPNAAAVDGAKIVRFRRVGGAIGAPDPVVGLRGLRITYGCVSVGGDSFRPELAAETTVDGATVHLGFTTGSEPSGSSFFAADPSFMTGEVFDLDRNRAFGAGRLVYSNPRGRVVSVDYSFFEGPSACTAHGVAVGG
jgi:hypothetical protein